jgi:hypothetical protein
VPIHAFAHASLAVLSDQAGLIILCNQVVEIVIGLENNVTAPPAIAAAGPALWPEFFPLKSHTALSPMTGARENLNFVNKHSPDSIRGIQAPD